MRLLLIAPYPLRSVPGQRFRFEQYLGAWEAAGIDVEVRSLLSPADAALLHQPGQVPKKAAIVARGLARRTADVLAARRFDAVYLYREAFPLGPPLFERALRAMGVPYVLDFDDAIWLQNSTAANRRFAFLKFGQKTAGIARSSALVTAGNEYLAAWTRPHQPNVRIIPTTIDTDLYRPRTPTAGGPLCIGWSGSTTTIAHLRTVEGVLAELQQERGFRLRVIGDPTYRLAGAEVEALPWREDTELEDLAPIDIGIMPLPDDEWARGKCGLKALQYMALGIPTVMSPVGVNAEIARDGAAMLASTPDEWRAVLTRLLDDAELRARLAVDGRARVVADYSVVANAQAYVDAVRSISRAR